MSATDAATTARLLETLGRMSPMSRYCWWWWAPHPHPRPDRPDPGPAQPG